MQQSYKLNGLDHLRAIAIILVLLFHYRMFYHPDWIDTVGVYGWTGVDLFFVLSGYLISSQLFREIGQSGSFSGRTFFIKRVFRILPPYLLVLGVYFLVPGSHEREALAPFWRYLSFTQNFGLDLSRHGTFSHAWSLCVEEQFYLLLPLTLLLFIRVDWLRRAWILLPVLFLGGLALRWYGFDHFVAAEPDGTRAVLNWYEFLYYPTYNRLDGLLAGISIAAVFHYCQRWRAALERRHWLLLLAGLLVLAIAAVFLSDQYVWLSTVFVFPVVSIGFGLIVAASVSPRNFMYKSGSFLTSWLATLSYSIYLSHKIVIHVVQLLLEKTGIDVKGNTAFLVCMFVCILVALLMHLLVEKPILRWRSRVLAGNVQGKTQTIPL